MNNSLKQSFGENPTEVRKTNHYVFEYVKSFVDKWDELIDWESRAESEGDFFIDVLKKHNARRILDVATGTGFHSVRLLKSGFDVVSADGSPEMLAKAFENARRHGEILSTAHADWRYLNRDIHGEFDAIVCLGNSFTHLFSENDRRKSLAEFYAMLKHDGILIIDQRNYDSILDNGFSSKHTYYYCGDNVSAEPEYIDEGLARFKYTFPDKSEYHLNMFPLRKDYLQTLITDVGFQRVDSFGDFQETYREEEPDFFIHVAHKAYVEAEIDEMIGDSRYSPVVDTARRYYNSNDADNFYFTIWGGEDIHIGLYKSDDEPIFNASRRTVERMAEKLGDISRQHQVIDLGSGYGGSARYLAKNFGCHVCALNLSENQNYRDREMTRNQGLDHLVEVVDGSFEDVPKPDSSFDFVWSQDAFLHSGDREKVISEAARLLKKGGMLVFTDPMQDDECPEGVLNPILERIHLDTLGSPSFYKEVAARNGLEFVGFEEQTPHLINHYKRVLKETKRREEELEKVVSLDYIRRMKKGLQNWIEGGKKGYLSWGIFTFKKI